MKFYYISTNSNYPNNNYGKYISKNEDELEYLLFMDKDEIKTNIDIEFNNNIDSKKWNSFPTNKVDIYMIDNELSALLEEMCLGEFELVNINLKVNKELIDTKYKLLHVLNHNKEKGNIYFDEKIYVSELFLKEYRKRKLKGWVFYDDED